jgi:hypothetical protein
VKVAFFISPCLNLDFKTPTKTNLNDLFMHRNFEIELVVLICNQDFMYQGSFDPVICKNDEDACVMAEVIQAITFHFSSIAGTDALQTRTTAILNGKRLSF